MKKTLFFVFLLIVACDKKDDQPTWYWGEISASKNGVFWDADVYAGKNKPYSQGIDILVDKFNDKGFKREDLFLFKLPLNTTRQILTNTEVRDIDSLVGARYWTLLDDGDAGGDRYNLLLNDSIPDFVEITEINGKEIKGIFQMSFVKDLTFGEEDPMAPDTILFLDGKFQTRLKD